MHFENMPPNEVSKEPAQRRIGHEVFPACVASDGDRSSGGVGQNLHPGARVLMSDYRGRGPCEHGVARRKRSVRGMILEKPSVPGALIGALASGDQLHCDVYRVSIQESLAGEESRCPGGGIIR